MLKLKHYLFEYMMWTHDINLREYTDSYEISDTSIRMLELEIGKKFENLCTTCLLDYLTTQLLDVTRYLQPLRAPLHNQRVGHAFHKKGVKLYRRVRYLKKVRVFDEKELYGDFRRDLEHVRALHILASASGRTWREKREFRESPYRRGEL